MGRGKSPPQQHLIGQDVYTRLCDDGNWRRRITNIIEKKNNRNKNYNTYPSPPKITHSFSLMEIQSCYSQLRVPGFPLFRDCKRKLSVEAMIRRTGGREGGFPGEGGGEERRIFSWYGWFMMR